MKKQGTYVLRKLSDEYVLIPCGETAEKVNHTITLSETAAFLYEHAEDAESVKALAKLLADEYGISEAEVLPDVIQVLNVLTEQGLLERTAEADEYKHQ